jgi:hypothetical protein
MLAYLVPRLRRRPLAAGLACVFLACGGTTDLTGADTGPGVPISSPLVGSWVVTSGAGQYTYTDTIVLRADRSAEHDFVDGECTAVTRGFRWSFTAEEVTQVVNNVSCDQTPACPGLEGCYNPPNQVVCSYILSADDNTLTLTCPPQGPPEATVEYTRM